MALYINTNTIPENRIKLFKIDGNQLYLYNYYPDAEISKGPYCIHQQRIYKTKIKNIIKELTCNGYIDKNSIN